MSTPRQEADRSELERFVNALFPHAEPGTFASLRSFAHRQGGKPARVETVQLNGHGLGALVTAAHRHANWAAGRREPMVFAPPVATFANDEHAAEADLAQGLVISLEADERPTAAFEATVSAIGLPTLVMASGGTWTDPQTGEVQDKLHLHWRLKVPTSDPVGHAKLKHARRLAALLAGADTTAVPAVHPLRWAGSLHLKDPDNPKLARIVGGDADVEVDLDEAIASLEVACKAVGLDPGKTGNGAGDRQELRDTGELVARVTKGVEYLAPLVSLSARYAAGGMSKKQIVDTLRGFLQAVPDAARDVKDGVPVKGRWKDRWDGCERMAASAVAKYGPQANGEDTAPGAQAEPATDAEVIADRSHDALALKLGARWVRQAGYVKPWDRWLFFDGNRWVRDEKLKHFTQTREFLREEGSKLIAWAERQRPKLIAEHGEGKGAALADKLDRWAKSEAAMMRNKSFVASVIELARSNPEQACTVEMWDAGPWLLGTPGGTLDLRTGALRSASLEDRITKLTAVAPAPPGTPTPMWGAFLARIFRHDPELIPYMQRVAGYALAGVATEHVLIFAWGQGGNGKTVFFNTLSAVLRTGEDGYAAVAPSDMLLQTHGDRHPADMAMLRGSRLAIASELGKGKSWDEPKLKNLTGGDPITARFMRQDFFTYSPQFTLTVAGNHKPSFHGVDEALRRRVQLVPFLQNIPPEERDPALPEKLRGEWPAILRWMIDGCLAWQRQGLNPPESVLEASKSYLEGEDVLGQWIAERCEVGGPQLTPLETLFKDWQEWCAANGGPQPNGKAFGKELDERGFRRDKSNGIRGFRHIKLKPKPYDKENEEAGWGCKL